MDHRRLAMIILAVGTLLAGLILIMGYRLDVLGHGDVRPAPTPTTLPTPTRTTSPTVSATTLPTGAPPSSKPRTSRSAGIPPTSSAAPEQGEFRSVLAGERSVLFDSKVASSLDAESKVDEPFPLKLLICGPTSQKCDEIHRPGALAGGTALRPPATQTPFKNGPSPLGTVKAGAIIHVEMTSTDPALTVNPLTPERQPLVEESDAGEWRWTALAKKAGNYWIVVEVTALRGDSDIPLRPTQIFDLQVSVDDTAANKVGKVGKGIKTGIEWGIAQIAGVVGIIAALVGAGYLVRSRKKRSKAAVPPRRRRGG